MVPSRPYYGTVGNVAQATAHVGEALGWETGEWVRSIRNTGNCENSNPKQKLPTGVLVPAERNLFLKVKGRKLGSSRIGFLTCARRDQKSVAFFLLFFGLSFILV